MAEKKQKRRHGARLTPKKRQRFLEILRETANVTAACDELGFSRTSIYRWRQVDEKFRDEWEEAMNQAIDALEQAARQRALHGVKEPVFHRGEVCGHIRKYSDTLTIFLLKAYRPERFRENITVTDPDGKNPLAVVADAIRDALKK